MDELERVRSNIKSKRINFKPSSKISKKGFNKVQKYVIKALVSMVVLLVTLIVLKSNSSLKAKFYKQVYEKNISFAYINKLYTKYFGNSLPFKNLFNFPGEPVFNETLKYNEVSLYMDGAKLIVDDNYLVPSYETGLVVFTGEKEGYGNVVIIEGEDGVEVWYGNLNTINVKLYDYIEKGSLIGEVNENYLYMIFKKDGEAVNYSEYLS